MFCHLTWLEFQLVHSCSHVLQRFQDYLDFLRTENGDLSTFWMSYVDMVEIVLGLVRASREGDFEHHLMCIRAMIPWCFAYDPLNYARYLPYYVPPEYGLSRCVSALHAERHFGTEWFIKPLWQDTM